MNTKMKIGMMSMAILAMLVFLTGNAHSTFINFECEAGYDLYAEYCATLESSTEQSYSPTHSIKYHLPPDSGPNMQCEMPYARVRLYHTSPLKDTSGTFKAYVTGESSANLAPYMMFRVDANDNGVYDYTGDNTGDSIVIAFITGATPFPQGQWFTTGLDSSTKVHVVGNRSGLAPGTYSASGTQDTLGNLSNIFFLGTRKWGDLNVLQVAVGAGLWPGNTDYTAYVDDIRVLPDIPTYTCVGFEPPCASGPIKVKKNKVIPLKAQLSDGCGFPAPHVSSPPVIQVMFQSGSSPAQDVTSEALSAGLGTDGNQFVFIDGKWQFNLQTKNYTAKGTYTVTMVSGDGNEYNIQPTCTVVFVIE